MHLCGACSCYALLCRLAGCCLAPLSICCPFALSPAAQEAGGDAGRVWRCPPCQAQGLHFSAKPLAAPVALPLPQKKLAAMQEREKERLEKIRAREEKKK